MIDLKDIQVSPPSTIIHPIYTKKLLNLVGSSSQNFDTPFKEKI